MRFGLQKLGRWTAGRLQGSKGVQKYDKYMDENPWAGKALTGIEIAGLGAGALAAAGGGSIGAGAGKVASLLKGTGSKVASGASKTANFVRKNKDLIEMGGKGIQSMMPDVRAEADMMRAETDRAEFDAMQQERQRQEEARKRMAELLMPMLGQYMQPSPQRQRTYIDR